VLRHQRRLDTLRNLFDASKMDGIETFGAAERQANAVQRDWKVAANRVE
jgi:hypothetical protein